VTVCSIVLDENPLADFVELPEHLQDLRCKLLLATAPRVMRVAVACTATCAAALVVYGLNVRGAGTATYTAAS